MCMGMWFGISWREFPHLVAHFIVHFVDLVELPRWRRRIRQSERQSERRSGSLDEVRVRVKHRAHSEHPAGADKKHMLLALLGVEEKIVFVIISGFDGELAD